MTKKRIKSEERKGEIDTEILRHFMLGGTDIKDENRPVKSSAEIDLHLDETSKASDLLSDAEKLNIQLKHLERQIDNAIANGAVRFVVIHGKGAGKLKNAVHDFLKKHPQVKSFRIMNDKKHSGGATEVFFK